MAKDIESIYNLFVMNKQYTKDTIIPLLKSWFDKNQNVKSGFDKPENIEFGDVVLFDISGQNHPCVIFKREGEICHGIVLSTKEREHHFVSKIENSRLFKKSNFTSTIISMPEFHAKDNFVGTFDSPLELKNAIKLVKSKYRNIL